MDIFQTIVLAIVDTLEVMNASVTLFNEMCFESLAQKMPVDIGCENKGGFLFALDPFLQNIIAFVRFHLAI